MGTSAPQADPAYRPWLVINDSSHPFASVECIAVGMTTQVHPDGIAVPDEAWVRGGSRKEAYISPWYVTTIKQRDLDDQQGELANTLVADAIEALHGFTPLPDS
ncbi:MAG: hypothetical protein ABEJ89_06610 [Haloarculaceae archaeon]